MKDIVSIYHLGKNSKSKNLFKKENDDIPFKCKYDRIVNFFLLFRYDIMKFKCLTLFSKLNRKY